MRELFSVMEPKKQKVLFVITKGNFGGAQRYVFDLATNLPQDQFETVVACGQGEELPSKLRESGIAVIKIDNLAREIKTISEFKVCKELTQIIKQQRPDIVHLNSSKIGAIGAVATWLVKLATKDYEPKIVFTAHNWGFNEFWRGTLSRLFFYLSHWLTILLSDRVIAVAEKIRRDMTWLPFTKEKIAVVYNGTSGFTTQDRNEARSFLSTGETNKFIILSISELHPTKGLDTALRALAQLPEERRREILYCIAGSGEWTDKLKKITEELGLGLSVRFLGFVPEARQYLSGADIFLLPSRNEAFPYVILEAGLMGLPLIATSVGGIPEVISDMRNGILIHKESPKEIAEAILYYLDHPEKQKEFGAEIKKTVANFFSLEKMLSETLKIYDLKIG